MTIEGSSGKQIEDKFPKGIGDQCGFSSLKPSYVDEDAQNKKLREKYNLAFCGMTKDIQYLEVIKMLEVKLFSAEASLKLSKELNANYEKTIKVKNEEIDELINDIQEANSKYD